MSQEVGKRRDYKRLTIDELKSFKGCENYTNEEAEEIIETLEQLTIVLFKLYKKQNNHEQSENT